WGAQRPAATEAHTARKVSRVTASRPRRPSVPGVCRVVVTRPPLSAPVPCIEHTLGQRRTVRQRLGAAWKDAVMATRDRARLADASPPIALGPLDGRYRSTVAPLVDHVSEPALNRERLHVEVEWLIHLSAHHVLPGAPVLSTEEEDYLREVVASFGPEQIAELAEIERRTVHDVKAVEYFLKARLASAPEVLGEDTVLPRVSELVHF